MRCGDAVTGDVGHRASSLEASQVGGCWDLHSTHHRQASAASRAAVKRPAMVSLDDPQTAATPQQVTVQEDDQCCY